MFHVKMFFYFTLWMGTMMCEGNKCCWAVISLMNVRDIMQRKLICLI